MINDGNEDEGFKPGNGHRAETSSKIAWLQLNEICLQYGYPSSGK